ncbi:MAG: ferritin family protein [Negativicutes bacterium]|nr:ferritin family protein [Negativicutes bacterium]
MSNLYNDLEGLRIAVEIETRGREFYRQAYEHSAVKEEKDLFLWLMNEEIHHQTAFTNIFNKINETKEAHSAEYLFDPEVSRYLTVLAEHHVFPAGDKTKAVIAELKSIQAILALAMQAEKDSVLFYDELANNARFPDAKKIFGQLKAEEQSHVVRIREMIDAWA